jgi:hypothetical protein
MTIDGAEVDSNLFRDGGKNLSAGCTSLFSFPRNLSKSEDRAIGISIGLNGLLEIQIEPLIVVVGVSFVYKW